MALAITFPRAVKVENTRLVVFYYVLALAAVAFVIQSFVDSDGYLSTRVPNGNVQFWPTNWNIDETVAKGINEKEAQNEYCSSPGKYEYCDTADCSWSAKNMQCMDICTSDSVEDCLETSERWVKEENGIFFPTYFSEVGIERVGGTGEPGKFSERRKTESWRIIKGAQEMGVGFQHEYNIRQAGQMQTGGSRSKETDYGRGVLTILKDSKNNEIDRWEPGTALQLTMQSILEAEGISLDKVDPEFGENFLKGATFTDGLLTRLGGAEVTIELSYHNPAQHNEAWQGPVAYLRIHPNVAWTSKPQLQIVDHMGSQRLRYYHGVRIKFAITGSFGWISPDRIINGLTSAMVLAGAAKNIIFIFAIYCLGVVSKVYLGFCYEDAKVSTCVYSLASRLICSATSFAQLKDAANGITESRLQQTMTDIFAHRPEMDLGELKRAVDFVFKGMKALSYQDDEGMVCQTPVIGIEDFAKACSSSEYMDFDTMIDLFDAHREKNVMERMFAGPVMRKLFASDKELREQYNDDPTLLNAVTPKLKRAGKTLEKLEEAEMEVKTESLESKVQECVQTNLALAESMKTLQQMHEQEMEVKTGSLESKVQECVQTNLALAESMKTLQQQIKDLQSIISSSSARRDVPQPAVMGRVLNKGGCCVEPISDTSEMLAMAGATDPAIPSKPTAIVAAVSSSDLRGSADDAASTNGPNSSK